MSLYLRETIELGRELVFSFLFNPIQIDLVASTSEEVKILITLETLWVHN